MKRAWLVSFPWPFVVEINRQLCSPKGALHRGTTDGYERTQTLWESSHRQEMTFGEATELCRRCHRLAPFCNFNGNTFVAVMRELVPSLPLSADQAAVMRSLSGHIVAGVATVEEQEAFQSVLARLDVL